MYVVYGLSVVKTAELEDFPAELKTAARLIAVVSEEATSRK